MGDTAIYQCHNCGHGGWTKYELTEGLCASCAEDEEFGNWYEDECE